MARRTFTEKWNCYKDHPHQHQTHKDQRAGALGEPMSGFRSPNAKAKDAPLCLRGSGADRK
jgi:hypothetical protein